MAANTKPLISIIVPVYNEEAVLPHFYRATKKALRPYRHEIIFVDDGSSDRSLQIIRKIALRDLSIGYISFRKNYGQSEAIAAGVRFCLGKAIIVMDADLQDPPSLLPEMIRAWQSGYKIALPIRKKRKEGCFKIASAKLFYFFLNLLSYTKLDPRVGEFYLFDRSILSEIGGEFRVFPRGVIQRNTSKKKYIPYSRLTRPHGQGSYSIGKMIRLGWSVFTKKEGLSTPPEIAEIFNVKRPTIEIGGAGLGGLALGYLLCKSGFGVNIYEKEARVGGLLQDIAIGKTRVEKFYHHFFRQDKNLIHLLHELKLNENISWHRSSVGFVKKKEAFPYSTPRDMIALKILLPVDRLRMVVASIILLKLGGLVSFKELSAKTLIVNWMGKNVWEKIWRPLFVGKFGPLYNKVPAEWFMARLKQRARSRQGKEELLGYLEGGFGQISNTLMGEISKLGGRLFLRQELPDKTKGDFVVQTYLDQKNTDLSLACLCLLLELEAPLTPFYWSNVIEEENSFSVIVEQTNLLDKSTYRSNILYLGRYLSQDSKLYQESDQEIKEVFAKDLQRLVVKHDFKVKKSYLFRSRAAQPVGFLQKKPAIEKDKKIIMNMSGIYPDDRGMEQAVAFAKETAAAIYNHFG
jgi:protoporphyrinogen oxidase